MDIDDIVIEIGVTADDQTVIKLSSGYQAKYVPGSGLADGNDLTISYVIHTLVKLISLRELLKYGEYYSVETYNKKLYLLTDDEFATSVMLGNSLPLSDMIQPDDLSVLADPFFLRDFLRGPTRNMLASVLIPISAFTITSAINHVSSLFVCNTSYVELGSYYRFRACEFSAYNRDEFFTIRDNNGVKYVFSRVPVE